MQMLSAERKQYLAEATSRYHKSLSGSPAEEHLASRFLTSPGIAEKLRGFRLGYVDDPMPGHESYKGMLCIPYLRHSPSHGWTVIGTRFRCLEEHDHGKYHGKYNTEAGDTPHLYNTVELVRNDHVIGITEGEPDTWVANVCDIPSVGVPGIKMWKDYYTLPFKGYARVLIFQHGDDAGRELANKLKSLLPNGEIIKFPEGYDVDTWTRENGKSELLRKVGL